MLRFKKSFTLVELMIVIAILAILSAIVIFALNPSRLFDNFRDTRRVTDISSIHKAISFMESWSTNGITYGDNMTVYLSLPDSSSTCSSYTLPTLATGYTYSCKPTDTYKNTDSTGWIPIDFTVTNGNRYLSSLPTDPINDSDYFYSYFPGGSYELIARLKNSNTDSINDNGYYDDCFELGSANRTNLTPIPKNLILNGEMESLTNWSGFTSIETTDAYEGSGSLKKTGAGTIWSKNYIKIYPNKRYRISVCLKSVGLGGLSKFYFGHEPWDDLFRQVDRYKSDHYLSTKTQLTEPLVNGNTTVHLTSTDNWTITPTHSNKIGVYPFEDYPEFTYTRNVYEYTDIDYDGHILYLKNEYTGDILPVGTNVAQNHGNIGTYMYNFSTSSLPAEWTCYACEIQGQETPMQSGNSQFRYGSQYIKILMLLNYNQDSNYSMLVDNVRLELIANE